MSPLETARDRYYEQDSPERMYLYPSGNMITDPLMIAAGSAGVLIIDKYITGGSIVGDIAQISAGLSFATGLIGAFRYTAIRSLDITAQQNANARQARMNNTEGEL